jgi:peroxiredoxin
MEALPNQNIEDRKMDRSTWKRMAFGCVGVAVLLAGCKPAEPKAPAAASPAKPAPAADPMPAPDDLKLPPEKSPEVPSEPPTTPPAEKSAPAPEAAAPAEKGAEAEKGAAATPSSVNSPIAYKSYFRAADGTEQLATIPPVLLTKQQEKLARIKVGDTFPAIELAQANGGNKKLTELMGKKATVVLFWKGDRRMSLSALGDLGPDVVEPFGEKGVAVVGVAVEKDVASAIAILDKAEAKFPNLIDGDGKAFAAVGSQMLPRTFLIDGQGKVLWFDIEYSHATRRELHEALLAVIGKE